ncbi:MAG: bifunctional riboflavin kinase/FAD synthetase [Chloroflexi bacterium]|nr:MAG: bifunctional riboflavin kinase/FAD synthetase [Chloroflexota bacterium]
MTHIRNLTDAQLERPSVVTIGVFDGVHRGHQQLLKRLSDKAREAGWLAVALTFFPHPDIVLRGQVGRYYLSSPEERAELLMKHGIDHVITHPFNEQVRQIRAADFVDMLLNHLQMRTLWVGANFAMGYKREGNLDFLRTQGEQKGFTVEVVDMMRTENPGEVISSTAIRERLYAGDVETAHRWLGRPYPVSGEVVHGEKRGRKIGFPTANVSVWEGRIIPANGVYAGWAWLDNRRYMAVTNVGVRPTFAGDNVTVEVHLLDFQQDIYGQNLRFEFLKRLRPEKKFDGIESLIAQINADVEAGRAYLTSLNG